MALAYAPPSVTVAETSSPSVAPLLAVPASVCLVGRGQGFQTKTEQVRIAADLAGVPQANVLLSVPANSSVTSVDSVIDALDPTKGAADQSGYVVTTDYTVSLAGKSITRALTGGIAAGSLVNVTYKYLPDNYFDPIRLEDHGSVEQRFGNSYKADGATINSVLSFAAGIAFENGASSIVLQPLFRRATVGDPTTARTQPTDIQMADSTTWNDTLFLLRDIEDINVIVPVVGQADPGVTDTIVSNIFNVFQDHMAFMKGNDQLMVSIFGEDSSIDVTKATRATLLSHAIALQGRYGGQYSQQTVFLSPSRFTRIAPRTGRPMVTGGQYMAVAIAGMIAARPVSQTLTRDSVSGFIGVPETRTKADKNAEAQTGLMVIEQKGQNVQVRHAVTLDVSSTATRELSVVRAKHRMIESVRDTIDTQIIGKVVADGNAPLIIRGAIIGVLERLRLDNDLVGYSDVQARTLSLDPTTVEVRFSYRPAFPLNYVNIRFALDLTSGTTSLG